MTIFHISFSYKVLPKNKIDFEIRVFYNQRKDRADFSYDCII